MVMDDKLRRLSFKDFTVVDYVPGMGQYINYQAQKRHRGTIGENAEEFVPHDMFDPETGERKLAKTYEMHLALKAKGWDHDKKKVDEMSNRLLNRYSDAAKKDSKKDRAKGMRKARNIRTDRANKGLFGSDIGEESVDEAMTVAQRIKSGQRMKKMSKRIQMAKKRSMKRAPSTEKLKLRARRQAKGALVSKWMKGKQKGDLSFAQRQSVEKRLKKASGRIDTMSKRLLPDVRKQDRERRANAKNKSEEK